MRAKHFDILRRQGGMQALWRGRRHLHGRGQQRPIPLPLPASPKTTGGRQHPPQSLLPSPTPAVPHEIRFFSW